MNSDDELRRPIRVVAIGGGTGLSTLLRGLKRYAPHAAGTTLPTPVGSAPAHIADLSAVVTVTDDGGSSGRLRKDLNMLPPGDVRNCMVALSENEAVLSRLFQYRFQSGEGLEGHSFGNLFLAALSGLSGDFAQAVRVSCEILATRGNIYPSTNENVTLVAEMNDGQEVRGETNITASSQGIAQLRLDPQVAHPLPETLEAIRNADLITIGPGSLFTSLIPNLLVKDIPRALAESRAVRVFVCNLMTQPNESLGLSAAGHVARILDHAGRRVLDYAFLNTEPVSAEVQERYALEGSRPIEVDVDAVKSLGVTPVCGNFLHEGDVVRHEYDRVAAALLRLAASHVHATKRGLN